MYGIDYATVKHSEAQFRSWQTNSAAPSFRSAPSQSTPSAPAPSSSSDVSLGDIMVQLQRMDARLDTLFMELYQVNVRVSHIVQRQAIIGSFAPEPTPSPPRLVASDSDDDDGDASSTDKMST